MALIKGKRGIEKWLATAVFFLWMVAANARQPADSLILPDSVLNAFSGTALNGPRLDLQKFYSFHPGITQDGNIIYSLHTKFVPPDKDFWFYWMAFSLFAYGLVRLLYPNYIQDMFRIFRKSTLQQSALRERLSANTLPGFLLNFLYVLNFGTFLYLLLKQRGFYVPFEEWWQQWLFFPLILSIIYLVKYFFNFLAGWMLNQASFFSNYLFIVFLINKMLAIFVLPFIVIYLFANESLQTVFWILGLFMVAGMFFLRYGSSLRMAGKELKLKPLHFFVYLCAFEIVPVLVLLKWATTHIAPA